MDYWEGKCFKCIVIGWLVAITALSVGSGVKNKKQTQQTQDTTLQQQ